MTTIKIPSTLLEQALESMCWAARVLNIDPDEAPNYHRNLEVIRAELAKPARCAQCGYQYGHQIGCVNNPVDIALSKQAIRAELAKPEPEETFIPDWANYRQGVADGKAGSPKWHDAPTEPGLWACVNSDGHRLFQEIASSGLKWVAQDGDRWYGPIPQDKKGGAA